MKVTVSISRPAASDGVAVCCSTDLDVHELDDQVISRLSDALRRCCQSSRNLPLDRPSKVENARADSANSHPPQSGGGPRLATEKQVRVIRAMAGRQGIDLQSQLHDQFSVSSIQALTIRQASKLIAQLTGSVPSA